MAGTNRKYIQESFPATAVGVNILEARQTMQISPLYALLHVSGTFTGSIQLEMSPPGAANWAPYGAAVTAVGASSVLIPADCDIRFNTTVTTGGPIACWLSTP